MAKDKDTGRKGPSAARIRERIAAEYDKRAASMGRKVKAAVQSQESGEVAGLVGAAAAGVAEANGVGVTLWDVDIPGSIPAGVLGYVMGRRSKNAMLRGAGHGAVCGGIAIAVSKAWA